MAWIEVLLICVVAMPAIVVGACALLFGIGDIVKAIADYLRGNRF